MTHFAKIALDAGGTVKPLIINSKLTNGTGLFNPSIYNDDGILYVNIRHCQYTLYHSELNIHEHPYGPLLYFNPENDITLTTTNYFGRLNDDLSLMWVQKVDTSKLDIKPVWEFIGLEDARIVRWNDNLYLSGVRRDTKSNGEGRMELSEIDVGESIKEVSRFRIPAPGTDNSYCEKNWMPILDQPYHYLKWCNPVEVVKVDPVNKTCETVYHGGNEYFFNKDQRGGGQVIPFDGGYLTLTHETDLYTSEAGKKNATYRHRFIHWTRDWKPIAKSPAFSFMNAKIEFACGLATKDNDILVTFGYQDNAAYVLRCPQKVVKEYMNA
jgi:hypothetical protein